MSSKLNLFVNKTKSKANKLINLRKNKNKYKSKRETRKNKYKYFIYIFLLIFLFIIFFVISLVFIFKIAYKKGKYKHDDITLVSAYYKIKSKHTPKEYSEWIRNLALLDRSIVFFSNKKFMPTFKQMRPIELHNKTVFIELEMEDFYSYKNFYNEFKQAFKIDFENRYHSVPLYLVWAEKCMFLKKAILQNYFTSKCFYWIDAGYFRQSTTEMEKYINNWPNPKKCFKEKKAIIGLVKNFSETEKQNIVNFDPNTHKKLEREPNVSGGFFGGKIKNVLKFIDYYYQTIRLFFTKQLFIGKDQNLFTYIAFAHPEIINLIFIKNYFIADELL